LEEAQNQIIATSRAKMRQRLCRTNSFNLRAQINRLRNPPKSAPAIPVVPINVSIVDTDFAPPVGKFWSRDIKRGGRDQVIEHNRVLLAPAETGNRL
jgi:hypothetical protein